MVNPCLTKEAPSACCPSCPHAEGLILNLPRIHPAPAHRGFMPSLLCSCPQTQGRTNRSSWCRVQGNGKDVHTTVFLLAPQHLTAELVLFPSRLVCFPQPPAKQSAPLGSS